MGQLRAGLQPFHSPGKTGTGICCLLQPTSPPASVSTSVLLCSHIAALLNIDSFPSPVFCSIISFSLAFTVPGLAGNSKAVFCLPAFLPRNPEGAPGQAESHQEITLGLGLLSMGWQECGGPGRCASSHFKTPRFLSSNTAPGAHLHIPVLLRHSPSQL